MTSSIDQEIVVAIDREIERECHLECINDNRTISEQIARVISDDVGVADCGGAWEKCCLTALLRAQWHWLHELLGRTIVSFDCFVCMMRCLPLRWRTLPLARYERLYSSSQYDVTDPSIGEPEP